MLEYAYVLRTYLQLLQTYRSMQRLRVFAYHIWPSVLKRSTHVAFSSAFRWQQISASCRIRACRTFSTSTNSKMHGRYLGVKVTIVASWFLGVSDAPYIISLWFHDRYSTKSGQLSQYQPPAQLEDLASIKTKFIKSQSVSPTAKSNDEGHQNGHYHHLASGEFRVLVVYPGKSTDELVCRLEHLPLHQSCQGYEALSYAWGDQGKTKSITTPEGEAITVTANLYSALKRLRYTDEERTLWADAVCIDQSDMKERSQQVQLMGEIYAKAARVIVWLGERDEKTTVAILTLQRLYRLFWIHALTTFGALGSRKGYRHD